MAFSEDIKRRIIADNLHLQEQAIARELEVRRSHLKDRASVLCARIKEQQLTLENIRMIGGDRMFSEPAVQSLHREVREENRVALSTFMSSILSYDNAVLAELVTSRLVEGSSDASLAALLPLTAPKRIAYVRNAYTDEAYDVFASEIPDACALFCDSYEEACGETSSDVETFCILPLRDTQGTLHRATMSYLETHALMAVAVVTVTDGEDVPMQYALCGAAPIEYPTSWELLLSLSDFTSADLSAFVIAVGHFGMQLRGVQGELGGELLATLRGNGSPHMLLVWLELYAPQYRIKGLYSQTEEE